MSERMRITVDRQPWSRAIELRIGVEDDKGNFVVARPVEMHEAAEGERVDPCLSIRPEAAQQLMDELWGIGVRPSQEEGSTGQAAAMQRHLDDMRTITFHTLKVKP
jgi:hypothetical protein